MYHGPGGGSQTSTVATVPVHSLAALGASTLVTLGEQVLAAVAIAVQLVGLAAASRGAVILEELLPLPPDLLEE